MRALFLAIFLCFLPTLSWAATSATIRWTDNSTNEDGFKLERNQNGGAFSEIARTGPNVASVVDPVLNPSTTYCYRVRAYNTGGDSGYSNTACVTTPVPTIAPPNAPSTTIVVIVTTPTENPGK